MVKIRFCVIVEYVIHSRLQMRMSPHTDAHSGENGTNKPATRQRKKRKIKLIKFILRLILSTHAFISYVGGKKEESLV